MPTDQLLNMLKNAPHKDWSIPTALDTKQGKDLLIVGSGRCVFDDLSYIGGSKGNFEVMAVNDMIMHLPFKLDHACSNDAAWLPRWIAARRPYYKEQVDLNQPIITHSNKQAPGVDHAWAITGNGTSGLTAALAGCAMNYDRIVLAGMPMDGTNHYFSPPDDWFQFFDSHNYTGQDRYWKRAKADFFDDKVRSLSGNTKELLGGIE